MQLKKLSAFLLLLCVILLASLHLYSSDRSLITQFKTASFTLLHNSTTPEKSAQLQPVAPDAVRIYIGIVTAWWNFGARLILRETYTHFKLDPRDTIAIRFVLGQPRDEDPGMKLFLQWEQERFGDMHFLNQTENMNNGKSYEYFADLARSYPSLDPEERPWDYAMKADDDSLINLPQLAERLRTITPRWDTYVGRGMGHWHMGAGYVLSWDLLTWLRDNRMEQFMHWNEDQAVGEMLRAGGRGKNFVNLREQVMDHPSVKDTDWSREYGDDVILVHRLKNVNLQGDAIEYFLGRHRENLVQEGQNVTKSA